MSAIKYRADNSSKEDFELFINKLSEQFPDVSFAKLSRIAVRIKKYLEKELKKL